MSTIEEAVRYLLINDAAVAALIGSRVYPIALPQGSTLPAAVFHMIDATEDDFGVLSDPRIQISCFAATYDGAKALRQAVKNCLKRYRGTAKGILIEHIAVEPGTNESRTPEGDMCMTTIDFRIVYRGE